MQCREAVSHPLWHGRTRDGMRIHPDEWFDPRIEADPFRIRQRGDIGQTGSGRPASRTRFHHGKPRLRRCSQPPTTTRSVGTLADPERTSPGVHGQNYSVRVIFLKPGQSPVGDSGISHRLPDCLLVVRVDYEVSVILTSQEGAGFPLVPV